MGNYTARFKKVAELDAAERRALAQLYFRYYEGGDGETEFFADLDRKTEVLLVHCGGALIGFTTSEIYERTWRGAKVQILYSGDTVVDRAHWGQQALSFAWIGRLGRLRRERPDLPLYWFVIVKGHRTFKFLPTFGKSFYPHWSIDRSDLKPLADQLAREKFGDEYDAERGVVAFARSRGHLKREIAFPSEEEKSRDAVRFFLERNPDYLKGHELVCLCEISDENMRPLTKRVFDKAAA
jgi:hypothetical protein